MAESSYQVLTTTIPVNGVDASGGAVPFGAIRGGTDINGQTLYMCVAAYEGGQQPGKIRSGFGACYIPYGGREIAVKGYTVLLPAWFGGSNTAYNVPLYDFQTGNTVNGTALYTCQGNYGGGLHPGSMTFDGDCNIGWGGAEHSLASGFNLLTAWETDPPK